MVFVSFESFKTMYVAKSAAIKHYDLQIAMVKINFFCYNEMKAGLSPKSSVKDVRLS